MTARNGQTTLKKHEEKIAKSSKWRQHHHDNKQRRSKIRSWVLQWKKERLLQHKTNDKNTPTFSNNTWRRKYDVNLPLDPLMWNPHHVSFWLRTLSRRYHFAVDCNLFAMNGKGLCLMSLEGFRYRSPDGGAVLHADLQRKLLVHLLSLVQQK